jgi:hypothetical protein
MSDGIELDLVGSYSNPYLRDKGARAERDARTRKIADIEGGKWSPDSDDFAVVVAQVKKTSVEINGVQQLLGAIHSQTHKIRLLNLITHSNPGDIHLRGTIVFPIGGLGANTVTFAPEADAQLSAERLAVFSDAPFLLAREKGVEKRVALADIQRQFTGDAVFVIYSCKGGVLRGGAPNRELTKAIARVFGVRVIAFTDLMEYCRIPTRTGLRFKIGIGECSGTAGTEDFRELVATARSAGKLVEEPAPK